jgi:ribosome-associated translation inhibitor RaiA
MTIEFQTPSGKVPEKIVSEIRDEILGLSHFYKHISRAEVVLREDGNIISAENKICEIRLTVYGDNLLARTITENFKQSSKEVIKELNRMVKQQSKRQKEPPDEMMSTVKVQ